MPHVPNTLSVNHLAKYGRYDELVKRIEAGEAYDLASLFERAVTDFRTIPRNPGHLAILKWCVDQGLDPTVRTGPLSRSIVSLAAMAGNEAIIDYLQPRSLSDDPFVWASIGEGKRLKDCTSRTNLAELHDINGFNLLFNCAESGLGRRNQATREGLTDVCRFLLDQGVDPRYELPGKLPITPVFLCASNGGNIEIMRLLLGEGALAGDRFQLALEHALEPHQRSGPPFFEIAECFLAHGLDLNEPSREQGRTLLHGAANRGSIQAVCWLLQHGANPHRLDTQGRTPLHVCAQRNTSIAVAELLVSNGAGTDALDSYGKTPLDYARERQRSKLVRFFEAADH